MTKVSRIANGKLLKYSLEDRIVADFEAADRLCISEREEEKQKQR